MQVLTTLAAALGAPFPPWSMGAGLLSLRATDSFYQSFLVCRGDGRGLPAAGERWQCWLRRMICTAMLPDHTAIALLLIDVINDLEFDGGEVLLAHALPMATQIAALKRRANPPASRPSM